MATSDDEWPLGAGQLFAQARYAIAAGDESGGATEPAFRRRENMIPVILTSSPVRTQEDGGQEGQAKRRRLRSGCYNWTNWRTLVPGTPWIRTHSSPRYSPGAPPRCGEQTHERSHA